MYNNNRMDVEELASEALKLDPQAREWLAERLWASLGAPTKEEWNRLWGAEVLRRRAEMDADPSIGIPAEEVFREMRAKFR